MEIKSNYHIDENKFKEFLYTLFKENEDTVYIEDLSDENNIILKHKEEIFSLPILFNMEKQKLAMIKTFLLKIYKKDLKYGGLVGVRPTKLIHKFLEEGKSFSSIASILKTVYLVSDEKIDLLINVVKNELKYIDKESVGVYIGLAFCPTKCTYCSFPAYIKRGKYLEKYDEYFDTIIKETKAMGTLLKDLKLKINTIYIGGGTPSFLTDFELRRLMDSIKNSFDLTYLEEFTFEAGRIDTITNEKLEILKEYNVDRISINPQSFKSYTLKLVNRYHNMDKLNEVYNKAKELGFIINMDYILGLPKESTEDILDTITKMKDYDTQNVTIHNLALKKSSSLTRDKFFHEKVDYEKIYESIFAFAKENKYIPYYMYRQKNSYIFGENIGFCKEGTQSRYNIDMIEENKNIFSIGAGSYTKLISKNDIKRLVMPKDPIVYAMEFEKRFLQKKEEIKKFYEKN